MKGGASLGWGGEGLEKNCRELYLQFLQLWKTRKHAAVNSPDVVVCQIPKQIIPSSYYIYI